MIEPMIMKTAHVFHNDESNYFKGNDALEHQIVLEDTRPIRKPQHRVPYALKDEMKTRVKKMLYKGVIRESTSLWGVKWSVCFYRRHSYYSGITDATYSL